MLFEKNTQLKRPKPVILIILDGWGIVQPYSGNAISQANIPNMKEYIIKYPAMTLRASGEAVGLPWGKDGNSEVGHLNLGMGRILYQDLPRINKSINDNSFYQNKALLGAVNHAKKNNSKLHLLGLASNGCVHASIEHLQALLVLAKEEGLGQVYIHAVLDGRDTPYNSAASYIKDIIRTISEYGIGKIASLSGRFYTLDRDNHWDRIEKAYSAMVNGVGNEADDTISAIEQSYGKKIFDEEFIPTIIKENGKPVATIEDNDAVIFFNFRPDRARQITKAFVLPGFDKFNRKEYLKNLFFVCFTEYEKDLPVEIAFPPEVIKDTLGEMISNAGLKQLRIAETEKYAHVTYFFNGGRETKSEGETHDLVPSPPVSSYDLKPEMSAFEVTDKLMKAISDDTYDFILVNFANADMVGHTGNIQATSLACEAVDKCVGKIVKATLAKEGIVLITADHGNAEAKFNMQTGTISKEHTANPVPFIIIGREYEGRKIGVQDPIGDDLSLVQPQGILSDVAPTVLKILGLEKPEEMTGRSLI
ncbi:MAG: 2,3-bisphosphoglycerate-independent phosphoglycerate mutase [Parcubacteria group bacterium GW2011_GWE2_39_37]|uniref:2,3-bisphosphoglycerate-independent phosphoglycerate mutase n=1 Tax=Candidatus Falkowbacteria bacterium GW2011_GWF2_39_8 TaxID=1618642 RepID=A0A0G0PSK8_9BACT|nr:MAG: 2,3-bisphosphoglycerate-independent phosphoglycerate mutase [Parcubacteria group bacterium GW2011_GWE2_39_37]KKR31134.1 MAG: 2,3-bisphosphoglycerate-independent phosphoglycerate mutase [Candidatus Falkowbacteria bacterium GW2011_GWF2_39_8]